MSEAISVASAIDVRRTLRDSDYSQDQEPNSATSDHTLEEVELPKSLEGGSEMLFAKITETSPGDSKQSTSNGRTYYLNEPFSLAYMVQVVCVPHNLGRGISVHYPIPDSIPDRAGDGIYLNSIQRDHLLASGAFELPDRSVSDALLQVYFEFFHPAYPVFDRQTFAELYPVDRMSPLALQAVYYIGATLCDDSLIREAGFSDRSEARITFYLRAKALYDADYERDKVTVTAVLFILGFVWQSPEDQKDSWHWLGQAISTAQTLGMHRSTARSGLSPHHRSLWKRIWWSVYVRDRHTAAALGRPVRIRDEDCDIEPLESFDFEDGETGMTDILGTEQPCHIHYAIEMAKLAQIFGQVLITEFAPAYAVTPDESARIAERLTTWKILVPPELNLEHAPGNPAFFWSRMLHAAFGLCQLLLYRPKRIALPLDEEQKREATAIMAANNVTRIAEDLLTTNTLRFGQLHLVPTLFAALSVHTIEICRKDHLHRRLAENRCRQCMLALMELSRSWPVAGWILRLFISLMRRLTGGDFDFEAGLRSNPASVNSYFLQQQDQAHSSNVALRHGSDSHVDYRPTAELSLHTPEEVKTPFNLFQPFDATSSWAMEQEMFQFDHLFRDVLVQPSTPLSYSGSLTNGTYS